MVTVTCICRRFIVEFGVAVTQPPLRNLHLDADGNRKRAFPNFLRVLLFHHFHLQKQKARWSSQLPESSERGRTKENDRYDS